MIQAASSAMLVGFITSSAASLINS